MNIIGVLSPPLPQRQASSTTNKNSAFNHFEDRLQCYAGVSLLFLLDRGLKILLTPFFHPFPTPLIGMTLIVATLVGCQRFNNSHRPPQRFFAPAVAWVTHKWLPCFYSPALVTLWLALEPLSLKDLAAAVLVISCGVVLTCLFTAKTAAAIRNATGTELDPRMEDLCRDNDHHHHHHHHLHFTNLNYFTWVTAAILSFLLILLAPDTFYPPAAFVLLLSSTLLGYMSATSLLPESVKRVIHPILASALLPNAVCYLLGVLNGQGYHAVLRSYVLKGQGGFGPGDLLFSFLGIIILCFGFKIFNEWTVLCRHAWEVVGK